MTWNTSANLVRLAAMAGIDQILSFIVQQGADRLHLGTDDEPQAYAQGVRRHFSMAKTPDPVLRHLLGDLLSPQRETELTEQRTTHFVYEAPGIGSFDVILEPRKTGGLDVNFSRSGDAIQPAATQSPNSTARTLPQPAPAAPVGISRDAHCAPNDSPAWHNTDGNASGTFVYTPRLQSIVEQAALQNASDVHLADGQPAYARVDGHLLLLDSKGKLTVEELFLLDEASRARLSSGHAVEASLSVSSRQRLRITLYQSATGLTAAIRLLPSEAPQLSELELPMDLTSLAELPNGLVLLCGATGSGKSTTLAALSRHVLDHRSVLLVTLEDPIEFQLRSSSRSLVRQRQIGRDVSSFTSGLRDALRSDPDVIMVGELRDAETIRLALTAAETGHLMLASIHSSSAASCIERVIDAYPADQRSQIRVQLADALRAIVVQRLLPRQRGSGRIAALEVLRVTRAVSNVIREGKTAQIGTLLQGGKREGMISIERCLADHVQSGTVSLQDARAAANDPDSLAMYLAK